MGAAGPGMALPAPLAGEDTTTTVGSAPHSSGHSPSRVPQLTASPSLPGSLCVPPGSASCDSSQPLPGTWGQRARAELAVPALWAQLGHPGSERSKAERTGASTESETGTEEGRREREERKDRKRKRGQKKTRTEKETGTLDRGGGREVSEHPRECPAATRSQCNTAQPRLGSAEHLRIVRTREAGPGGSSGGCLWHLAQWVWGLDAPMEVGGVTPMARRVRGRHKAGQRPHGVSLQSQTETTRTSEAHPRGCGVLGASLAKQTHPRPLSNSAIPPSPGSPLCHPTPLAPVPHPHVPL